MTRRAMIRAASRLRPVSPRLRGLLAALPLAILPALGGCDLTAPEARPDTLVVTPGNVELDALAARLPLRALVRDQAGGSIAGALPAWEVEDPSVVIVSDRGVVQALAPGETRVRARFGDAEGWARVVVALRASEAALESGEDQVARADAPLPQPLRFQLRDRLGTPLAGIPLTFALPDGGSVEPAEALTGADGRLEVRWQLGPDAGVQSLVARDPTGRTFHFAATATLEDGSVPFRIRIRTVGPVSPAVLTATRAAAHRWERTLGGKLPPLLARTAPARCGAQAPALDEVVDDLLVLLSQAELDGPGGAAAVAGPCFLREGSLLPVVGRIVVDGDDVETLEGLGLLEDVIAHELGHVLGVGTLWGLFDLVRTPSLPDTPGADTWFAGPLAIQAFGSVGGGGYSGPAVPVENEIGEEGVRDVHWRESVLGPELLTPLLWAGVPNPLSRITVASLGDLGYDVRVELAEDYRLPDDRAAPFLHSPDAPWRIRHLNRFHLLYVLGVEGRITHLYPAWP